MKKVDKKYNLKIERSAQKKLFKIPSTNNTKIKKSILELQYDPFPNKCKKLKGREAFRIRVSDYRVIYEIKNEQLLIIVIEIGHRKNVYK